MGLDFTKPRIKLFAVRDDLEGSIAQVIVHLSRHMRAVRITVGALESLDVLLGSRTERVILKEMRQAHLHLFVQLNMDDEAAGVAGLPGREDKASSRRTEFNGAVETLYVKGGVCELT